MIYLEDWVLFEQKSHKTDKYMDTKRAFHNKNKKRKKNENFMMSVC